MTQNELKTTLEAIHTSVNGIIEDVAALKNRIADLEAAGTPVDPGIAALALTLAAKTAALDAATPAVEAANAEEPPPGDPGPGAI